MTTKLVTKRPRPSSPLAPNSVFSLLNDFATRGWIHMQNLLSPSELQRLQDECSALYTRQSAEEIAEQGCVLDVMAQCPMRDSATARVDSSRYLEARAKQLNSVDDAHQVFSSLVFEKLPAIAGQLMADCTEFESEGVFFFNEHYVVKPPQSHVEFRWHRDDDEQLAMCVHRETIRPYVSAWCALDDVSSVNGALQFVSLDVSDDLGEEAPVEHMQLRASVPVAAKAGDVLFFLSNVWHCSSSNESDAPRRAFYAQYSSEKITARPKEVTPLSFAIPCNLKSAGLLVDMATASDSDKSSKKIKHSDLQEEIPRAAKLPSDGLSTVKTNTDGSRRNGSAFGGIEGEKIKMALKTSKSALRDSHRGISDVISPRVAVGATYNR